MALVASVPALKGGASKTRVSSLLHPREHATFFPTGDRVCIQSIADGAENGKEKLRDETK